MDEKTYKLPLGLCKQASLKLESFIGDIHEILEDEEVPEEDRPIFETMIELGNTIMVQLTNTVKRECGEEEFIAETIPMDEIGTWPGEEGDLLDTDAE